MRAKAVFAVAVLAWISVASAQTPQGGKKKEASQTGTKKETPPAVLQDIKKPIPPKKPAPPRINPAATPKNDTPVLAEDTKTAIKEAQEKGLLLVDPAKWKAAKDRLDALEKKLREEKKYPHSCKLSGNVDGDYVFLQADFVFSTDLPQRTVVLGLQGANLLDEGDFGGQAPILDYGPDGYTVLVEKPGARHQLTLKLKLPLNVKRSGVGGGSSERSLELGLPGAAVTLLSLALPAAVKEVRWNEHLEKRQAAARGGRWELALGKIKSLNLSWKEPAALPGNAPLLTADAQVTVTLEENQAVITAELTLANLRGEGGECRLLLPPQAKVEVKSGVGPAPKIIAPERGSTVYVIRMEGSTAQVSVQIVPPRPFNPSRVPIGPFALLGAFEQQGNITVKASLAALRGYRLVYHRAPETYQREVPVAAGSDTVAQFHYDKLRVPVKNVPPVQTAAWAPLQLELRPEKGQLETQVDHLLKLNPVGDAWQADLTTKIKIKSLSGGVEFLDMQLPRCRPEGLAVLDVFPFPAGLPWGPLYLASTRHWPMIVPADFTCQADTGPAVEMQLPDSQRRSRIILNRADAREVTLTLTGRYLLPADARRATLELPRPLDDFDRGGKVTVNIDEQFELFLGEAAAEEPLRGQHQQTISTEQAPRRVEFAWQPYRPDFPVTALTDIHVHNRNAHVRHQLKFAFPQRDRQRAGRPHAGQVLLRIPPDIRALSISQGGRTLAHERQQDFAWVGPADDNQSGQPVVVDYDLTVPPLHAAVPGHPGQRLSQIFAVPLVWPAQASRIDAKVRVWCDPGVTAIPARNDAPDPVWRDRGTEMPDELSFPNLVLHGMGLDLPLSLRLLRARSNLPALELQRGLVQAAVSEDGAQFYRARFIAKLNADHIDVKLPAPVATAIQSISLSNKRIDDWTPLESDTHVARVPIPPALYGRETVLELHYKLPASLTEGERLSQMVLFPPEIQGDIFLGRVRWQVALAPGEVALVEDPRVQPDYRWAFRDWLLTPRPGASSEELDRWLDAGNSSAPTHAAGMVFWRTALEPLRIWHVPRLVWLLACSALVLILGLGLSLMSVTRFAFWLLIALMTAGGLAAALLWPALLPLLIYGAQPGLAVLLVLLAIQWLLQERYRRQVVFMPGFTRLKSNSSLVVNSAAPRPREPSTVDAPAAAGSPAKKQ